MTRAKLGLLGLCAVVFGLMGLSTAAAQATVGAKWLILNVNGELREAATLPAAINLVKDSSVLVLHTEILKIKVLFLCTELKAVNAKLLANGSIGKEPGVVSGSQILFSGCDTDLNGVLAPECTPTDPVDGAGFIVSKLGHGLLELHELSGGVKDDIVKLLPDVGDVLAHIVLPAGCPLGTLVPIIGKLALKDCENLALTHLVKHLVEQFSPLTEMFAISKTVEHTATLLGSAWAFLTGAHVALGFSGDPA